MCIRDRPDTAQETSSDEDATKAAASLNQKTADTNHPVDEKEQPAAAPKPVKAEIQAESQATAIKEQPAPTAQEPVKAAPVTEAADKKNSPKWRDAKPQANKPQNNSQQGNRPQPARPQNEKGKPEYAQNERLKGNKPQGEKTHGGKPGPVSYTHLDVYKRQIVIPRVLAMISRNLPVPAEHLSFMIKSRTLPLPIRIILLSCPPISITVAGS